MKKFHIILIKYLLPLAFLFFFRETIPFFLHRQAAQGAGFGRKWSRMVKRPLLTPKNSLYPRRIPPSPRTCLPSIACVHFSHRFMLVRKIVNHP
jgi:hypothetical protein